MRNRLFALSLTVLLTSLVSACAPGAPSVVGTSSAADASDEATFIASGSALAGCPWGDGECTWGDSPEFGFPVSETPTQRFEVAAEFTAAGTGYLSSVTVRARRQQTSAGSLSFEVRAPAASPLSGGPSLMGLPRRRASVRGGHGQLLG